MHDAHHSRQHGAASVPPIEHSPEDATTILRRLTSAAVEPSMPFGKQVAAAIAAQIRQEPAMWF